MKNKLTIFIIVTLVLLIAGTFFVFRSAREDGNSVFVKRTFYDSVTGEPTKIIYETTGDGDLTAYQKDCAKLDGFFEACGNICEPGATACVEVCGVTCTFSN